MFYNCLFNGKCNENDYIILFIKRHIQLTFWRYQNLRTQVKVKSFIIYNHLKQFLILRTTFLHSHSSSVDIFPNLKLAYNFLGYAFNHLFTTT